MRSDTAERLWVWKYSEGQEKFYMDLQEEIRFRVTNINFTRVTKTAKGRLFHNPYDLCVCFSVVEVDAVSGLCFVTL